MAWLRSDGAEQVTPTEARQGFRDRPVLLVLVASLGLAFIGLAWVFGALL
jgi:hypothetical protein